MPMYDRVCDCGYQRIDTLERIADSQPWSCPLCGEDSLVRGHVPGQRATSVNPDDIPGGLWMKNGICNDDGTPKRYDSRSEIRRALKEKGYVWGVDVGHVGKRGSDKHPDSKRWT